MGAHGLHRSERRHHAHIQCLPGNHHHYMIGRTGQACCLIVRRYDRHGRVFPVGSIVHLPHSFENQSTRRRWVRNYRFSGRSRVLGWCRSPSPHCRPMDQNIPHQGCDNHHSGPHGCRGHHRSRCVRGNIRGNCHQEHRSPSICSVPYPRCNRLAAICRDLTCVAAGPTQVHSADRQLIPTSNVCLRITDLAAASRTHSAIPTMLVRCAFRAIAAPVTQKAVRASPVFASSIRLYI